MRANARHFVALYVCMLTLPFGCGTKESAQPESLSNVTLRPVQEIAVSKAEDEMPVVVLKPKATVPKVKTPVAKEAAPKVPCPPGTEEHDGFDNDAALPHALSPSATRAPYPSTSDRDPFRSYLQPSLASESDELQGDTLSQPGLSDYRFVGVILSGKGSFALLEDANGQGLTVRVGSAVGKGLGTVTSISANAVVIRKKPGSLVLKLGR